LLGTFALLTSCRALFEESVMKLKTTGAAFAILLGALAALPPISIDMALPALTKIGADLDATGGAAGLTLSLFMAGFAISPFFYGPFADRHGRRPLLLIGLLLFSIGGLAASLAPSIGVLLAARLIQGAGAGAGMTLAMAMVRDLFEGRTAQSRLAVVTVVSQVAPIVAPVLGAALLGCVGWRGIYGVTAVCGLLLLLIIRFAVGETATIAAGPKPPLLGTLLRDYRKALGHGSTMAHIVVNALGFGWLFSYVSGSPLVLIDHLHASPALYSMLFACTGGGIVAGATLSGRLVQRGVSPRRLLFVAVSIAVAATASLAALSLADLVSIATIMPLLVLSTAAFGLAAPCAAHGALESLPKLAGITGGLLTSVQMLAGAIASLVVSMLFPHWGTLAMTGTMACFALLALPIAMGIARGDRLSVTPAKRGVGVKATLS
jgi:DHA1 family bicyclomycin/chloramphenicol resistance-like MFS transporter